MYCRGHIPTADAGLSGTVFGPPPTAPSASTHALYGRDRPVSAALLGVLKLSVPSGKRISDATIFEAVQGVAGDPDRTRAARLLSKEASEELASLLQYVCFPSYD